MHGRHRELSASKRRADARGDGISVTIDLPVAEAPQPATVRVQEQLTLAVVLECLPSPMGRIAVGLDHEPSSRQRKSTV
jgi:hypothetical protein